MLSFSKFLVEAKKNPDLNLIKKVSREARLAHEFQYGKPRAKSFGGKPSPRQERRLNKRNVRDQL
jgi:hypothetical protein